MVQAGRGQLELVNRARPIDEVIADERTPPRIAKLLSEIALVKKFGESAGLKPTKNYTEYVQLKRPAAVWVVSACAPLKFESREWSFPFFGAFPYLGWFDLEDGRKFASELKKENLDVDLRGARAFSTLGWFRDPVVSTMISDGPEAYGDLANVVIHESVHATLYISGQAFFNESLAEFVAAHLTLTYIDQARGADSPEKKSYVESQANEEKYINRMHVAYESLSAIYASDKPDADKLAEKARVLESLKTDLGFKRDVNNATLIQFREYNTGGKEFDAVYEACGKDWRKFLNTLSRLKPDSFTKSQQQDLVPVLTPLAQQGCPQG